MAIPMPPEPADPWRNPFLPKDQPKPQPTKAEDQLRLALRVSKVYHTLSMAQRLGIYPA